MLRFVLVLLVALVVMPRSSWAQSSSNPEREFLMSCTYGVLAGTLVGAASLAFVDKPGDNLQRVARGASLGLYLGIGLGLYTVYILPKQLEREAEEQLDPDRKLESDSYGAQQRPFHMFPFIAGNDGGGLGFVYRF